MLDRLTGDWPSFRTDPLGVLARQTPAQPGVARLRFGPVPVWVLTAPAAIQAALVTHADAFDKGPLVHQALAPVMGQGVLNAEGAAHHACRHALAPAFQPRHLADYAAPITEHAAATV